jgi:hypothetical protein
VKETGRETFQAWKLVWPRDLEQLHRSNIGWIESIKSNNTEDSSYRQMEDVVDFEDSITQ